MKKINILLFVASLVFFWACSEDSSDVAPTSASSESNSNNGGGSSGQGGSLAKFKIVGDFLYVLQPHELFVYDISRPDAPKFLSSQKINEQCETLFATADHLYMGTTTGMLIYNITNKSNPTFVSIYRHVESCDPVVVNGNMAYVTLRTESNCRNGENRLDVVDISNKANPYLVQSIRMIQPRGLGYYNNKLYVCETNGINIFDVDQNGELNTSANIVAQNGSIDLIPFNNLLISITTDGLRQYQIEEDGMLKYLTDIR